MDAIIDENKKSWLQRFILWREKKIKEKHFILIFYRSQLVVFGVSGFWYFSYRIVHSLYCER